MEALLRVPNSVAALLQLITGTIMTADAPAAAPPEVLLCCQLLQKTLRRAPTAELEGVAEVLLPLLRSTASMSAAGHLWLRSSPWALRCF